jgi:putative heme iron utilization protein
VLIHLSNLAPHKRQLIANPRCSLLIAAPDPGTGEVMALPRVTLQGTAALIPKGTPDYEQAKARYLAKLPTSSVMFSLVDFDLFRITPAHGRFIAGFGRIVAFEAAELRTDAVNGS